MADPSAPPQLTALETSFPSDRTVRVDSVRYSSDGLFIVVTSEKWDATVIFEQTYGFRVLDELDLTEFWSQCSLADGWLFEVHSGGWKSLELTRPHFVSGRQDWVREYLVIGVNECVSVLSKEKLSVIAKAPSKPSINADAMR